MRSRRVRSPTSGPEMTTSDGATYTGRVVGADPRSDQALVKIEATGLKALKIGNLDDELALLVVHGILHVLGHDHAEPADQHRMRAREVELLEAHHVLHP